MTQGKLRDTVQRAAILVLSAFVAVAFISAGAKAAALQDSEEGDDEGNIKWADFGIPYSAMNTALSMDIQAHGSAVPLHFVDLLAYLGTKYGGNWRLYKQADMTALAQKLKTGDTMAALTSGMKNYSYYSQVYDAVLGNFVGDYAVKTPGSPDYVEKYGLKVYAPVAAGYSYSHYDDFGSSRSFGFARRHLGNDLMGSIGTPIVAVESGYVESMGWNKYGGWRIGIRSFDNHRYYYYAHLRKGHPYRTGLKQGDLVRAGDVIGYLGMTGYSTSEDVNNMQKPHLHFGMQLIFNNAERESKNEIWINVYNIVNLLAKNCSQVHSIGGGDSERTTDYVDMRYLLYME